MTSDTCPLRIAVSGAAGFIGRHVLAELAGFDVEVIALARPGKKDLPSLARGRWVSADFTSLRKDAYRSIGSPDVLIHLAWQGLPNYRSLHHIESELALHYDFLKNLVGQGLPSLVVAGTCLEYGMQYGLLAAQTETRPITPYGLAKDMLRRQLEFLSRKQAFHLAWARLFYMYGEGQSPASLYPQIRAAVRRGEKVFHMSGGEQLLDFLPVGEVACQLVDLALRRSAQGIFNICSGRPVSVRNLVEKWIRENHWSIECDLGYYPYSDYEPMAFWGKSNINDEENDP